MKIVLYILLSITYFFGFLRFSYAQQGLTLEGIDVQDISTLNDGIQVWFKSHRVSDGSQGCGKNTQRGRPLSAFVFVVAKGSPEYDRLYDSANRADKNHRVFFIRPWFPGSCDSASKHEITITPDTYWGTR